MIGFRLSLTLTQSDGHDYTNEALKRFENSGTHFIFHFEKHFVFCQRFQRIHEEGRIKRHLKIGTIVADCHGFVRFAEIRTRRKNFEQIAADFDFYRVGFFGTDQLRPMHTLQQ